MIDDVILYLDFFSSFLRPHPGSPVPPSFRETVTGPPRIPNDHVPSPGQVQSRSVDWHLSLFVHFTTHGSGDYRIRATENKSEILRT
jgi:hypothetical protein